MNRRDFISGVSKQILGPEKCDRDYIRFLLDHGLPVRNREFNLSKILALKDGDVIESCTIYGLPGLFDG